MSGYYCWNCNHFIVTYYPCNVICSMCNEVTPKGSDRSIAEQEHVESVNSNTNQVKD